MKKVKEWLSNKNAQFEVLVIIDETHIFKVVRLNDGQNFTIGDLLSINYPTDKNISFHSIGEFAHDCIHVTILVETQKEEEFGILNLSTETCEINELKKPIGTRKVEDVGSAGGSNLRTSYEFFDFTPS